MESVTVWDFEELARKTLSRMAFDYFASGAHDELTLRENRAAFERLHLYPRVLVDVSTRELSTTVLGATVAMPILVAPTAFHRLAHPDGEVATARGAAAAGTVFVLSSLSNTTVEEVMRGVRAKNPAAQVWFQLYVYKDRGATKELIARVENAGCTALVLTVDAPILGTRERDVRNRFALPEGLTVANMVGAGYGDVAPNSRGSGLAAYVSDMLDPSLTWKDVEWLRGVTSLPILLKGIVRTGDVRRAVKSGVAGVVVSNHGGRQLDTVPATIDVLPRIVDAAGGHLEVLMDGGVRRGTDVVKALALGARAVLVGRPVIWGLAVAGELGVARVLETLKNELSTAMALCGCTTVDAIPADLVQPAGAARKD